MDENPLFYVVGAVLIAVYGIDRFKIPHSGRSETTMIQYWVAFVGYIVTGWFIAFIFAQMLETNKPLLGKIFLSGLGKEILDDLLIIPPPLLAVLLLTVLFPYTPALKKVDHWLKKGFEQAAAIPKTRRELKTLMEHSRFQEPQHPEQLKEHIEKEKERFGTGRIKERGEEKLHDALVKVIVLYTNLKMTTGLKPDDPFLKPTGSGVNNLTLKNEQICRISSVFGEIEKTSKHYQILKDTLDYEMKGFQEMLIETVSRGVLQTQPYFARALLELKKWGFVDLSRNRIHVEANHIAGVIILLFVAFFAYSLQREPLDNDFMKLPDIIRVLAIALIMGLTPLWAVLPRLANWRKYRKPGAVIWYIVSAVIAAGSWAAIFYITYMFVTGDSTPDIVKQLKFILFTIVLPSTSAFILALIADCNHLFNRWMYIAGGTIVFALCLMGALFFADKIGNRNLDIEMYLFTAGIGIVLGLFSTWLYSRPPTQA